MTLTGTITFERVSVDSRGLGLEAVQNRPAPGIVVTVEDAQGQTLGSTSTSQVGDFTVSFTTSLSTVSVVAYSKTLEPPIQVEDNTDGNSVYGVMRSVPAVSGTVRCPYPADGPARLSLPAVAFSAPFAILDTMATAARAFTAVRSVTFP